MKAKLAAILSASALAMTLLYAPEAAATHYCYYQYDAWGNYVYYCPYHW